MENFVPWASYPSWRALTYKTIEMIPLKECIDRLLIDEGFFVQEIHVKGNHKFAHADTELRKAGILHPNEQLKYVVFGIVFKKIYEV